MLGPFLTRLEFRVKALLRRAGFAVAGAIMLGAGIIFLTVAAWVSLTEALGTVQAALIIGGAFVLAGAILLALSARRPRVPVQAAPPLPVAEIITAFFAGMGQGAQVRHGPERRPDPDPRDD